MCDICNRLHNHRLEFGSLGKFRHSYMYFVLWCYSLPDEEKMTMPSLRGTCGKFQGIPWSEANVLWRQLHGHQ